MSEFASLDSSLPLGLGHYEVVTVGFVDNGQGKPHVKVGQKVVSGHGLLAQNNNARRKIPDQNLNQVPKIGSRLNQLD